MNYKQSVALNSWKYSCFSLDLLLTHIWSFTLKPLIENSLWLLELKKQQQTLGFLSLNSSVSAFRTKILITPLKATLAHYKLEQQSLLYCLCTSLICFDISETPHVCLEWFHTRSEASPQARIHGYSFILSHEGKTCLGLHCGLAFWYSFGAKSQQHFNLLQRGQSLFTAPNPFVRSVQENRQCSQDSK